MSPLRRRGRHAAALDARPQHEYILSLAKGSRAGNRRDLGTVPPVPRPGRGAYPTEKPVALLSPLIAQSSRPGELVLDPFCGPGSVGQAARALGRRALLCDLDAAYAGRRLRLVPTALGDTPAGRNGPAPEGAA